MQFFIQNQTLMKFLRIAISGEKLGLGMIRLEHSEGKTYAISTNQKFVAVQYLGPTQEPDGVCHVAYMETLLNLCSAMQFQPQPVWIRVTDMPMMKNSQLDTSTGQVLSVPPCIYPEPDLMNKWRTWIPNDIPQYGRGRVQFDAAQLALLANSSPTGNIVFPPYLNAHVRVVLRDRDDPNWLGVFNGDSLTPQPLGEREVLPTWWNS